MSKFETQLISYQTANHTHYWLVIMGWALPSACENIVIISLIVKGIVFLPEWEFVLICHYHSSPHRVPSNFCLTDCFLICGWIHFLFDSCTLKFSWDFFHTYFSSLYPTKWFVANAKFCFLDWEVCEVVKEPSKIPVCAGLGQRCGGNWLIIQRW